MTLNTDDLVREAIKATEARREAGRRRAASHRARAALARAARRNMLPAFAALAEEERRVREDRDLNDDARRRKLARIEDQRLLALAEGVVKFKEAEDRYLEAFPTPEPPSVHNTGTHLNVYATALNELNIAPTDRGHAATVLARWLPAALRGENAAVIVVNTLLPVLRALDERTRDAAGPEARAGADALARALDVAEAAGRTEDWYAADEARAFAQAVRAEHHFVVRALETEGRWTGSMTQRSLSRVQAEDGTIREDGITPLLDAEDRDDGVVPGSYPEAPTSPARVRLTREQASDLEAYGKALAQVGGDHARVDVVDAQGNVIDWAGRLG